MIRAIVDTQRLRNIRSLIEVVGVNRFEFHYPGVNCLGEIGLGNFFVSGQQNFAGFFIDDVMSNDATHQEIFRDFQFFQAGLFHLADMLDGNTLIFLYDQLARFGRNIELSDFATHTLRHDFKLDALLDEMESIGHEKVGKNLFRRIAQCLQQYRNRHFAATVNAEIQVIFGVEFEVEPRAAVGNHAG